MKKISRRSTFAIAGAAIPAMVAGSVVEAAPSSELDALIEAHKQAEARFLAAVELESEWEGKQETPEIHVALSIGGAQSVHVHHTLQKATADLRNSIATQYRVESQHTSATLQSVSPDLSDQVKAALRKAQANDLRKMRRAIREQQQRWEASGYAAFKREYEGSSDAERDTLNAVLAYRCTTMVEVAKKASYISKALQGCIFDHDQVELLLDSMLDEEAAS